MKSKLKKHFLKRVCSAGLSLTLLATLFSPVQVRAAEPAEGTGATLEMAKGGTHFFEGATMEGDGAATTSDSSVVTLEAETQSKKALFDCTGNASHSLDGYSPTPNWDANVSDAEFVVTANANGHYTIFDPDTSKYLANINGNSYMADSEATHELIKVDNSDGTVSFQIKTAGNTGSPANGRYVYFRYDQMKFDAMDHVQAGADGDYGIEFLEKKDDISNLDPIPGYRRATEITSGNRYLITEYYEDGIIVVYPHNGNDLSKLYHSTTVSGVLATAVGDPGTTATITVGGTEYAVTITGCNHQGYPTETKDAREPDCVNKGYSGDVYCTHCNQIETEGSDVPALGHTYGDWTVTAEPTADADGSRNRTCGRCDDVETEVYTYGAHLQVLLDEKIAKAEQIVTRASDYESVEGVQSALDAAKGLAETASASDKKAALDALDAAIKALVIKKVYVSSIKPTVTDTSLKNYFTYAAYSGKNWRVFDSEAYIDLGGSDANAEQCYYEIHFEGNAISVFSRKSHNHGIVKFTVDGGNEETVDLYNSSRLDPQVVYTAENLTEGEHVLKAVTQTTKNSASTAIVNQVVSAEITHEPYTGGTPNLGGTICDTNTQYTQDRYSEISTQNTAAAELTAWKNDKAVSELVLYSKNCSLNNVTVTTSALTSGSNTIPAENVTATFIKSTKAYNGGYLGYGDPNRDIPEATTANRSESSDILYQQGGAVDIAWDELQPVWIEYQIPKDAAAGTYTGTLTATADGITTPLTFTYTVNVQDMELPDAETFADTFDIELWQYPYSSAEYYDVTPFSEEHLKLMKSSMLKYKEIGGHAITTTISEEAWGGQTYSKNNIHYPSMVKWTKEGDSFAYDYTDFDKWVEFCKNEIGIGDKIVLYSIAPWHASFTYWENGTMKKEAYSAGNPRYNKVWGDFLRDLIAHLEKKGWFDDSYVGIDERGFCAEAFDLIESVTNDDGECLKTAGAMDGFVNKRDLAMRVTDLNVGDNAAAAHPAEFAALLKQREEAGLRTTLYSCTEHKPGNFSLSAPVENYYSIVNAAKMGTAGFLRWAYDAWVEDPLNDATHNAFEPGDCFLVYPDEKDAETPTSKSSVRLERMAEGVRDVNKLIVLEQESPELADEIKSLYEVIKTTQGSGRSYLSDAEKNKLATEMTAFKTGVADITEKHLQFKNATEQGFHLLVNEKELEVGSNYRIAAKLVTDGADKTIQYESSDTTVASVDAQGAVTARKPGTAQITLKNGSYTATVQITVTQKKNLIIKNALTDYQLPEKYLSDVEKAPDRSDPRHYLGQPDMIMLDDNQTLITVYPVGHGRGRIVMQVSRDAGEHWEEKTDIPESWFSSNETPTIYKLSMTNGDTKLIVISGRPASFAGANTPGGFDTSISTDNGESWSEYQTHCATLSNGNRNETVVAMASLVQLKDSDGNYIDKWMGVYHDGGSFVNYKTYLTFDEDGNDHWSEPVAYLSDYRSIESSHQICEVGMFRSPDGKRIVALARNQTHNGPATMFYSDDEGETWSEPVELPGSLAGERHKVLYDPTDPTGQRIIIPFREIQYDFNNNNRFDGGDDWMAGDWIAWVGTYDQLMNLEQGQYRILLCEDWTGNPKSGDTGYTGLVVQPDGTFIMDTYGHWDKSSTGYSNPHSDLCWIKQAKFKLSIFDAQVVPGMITDINAEIAGLPNETEKSKYTEKSWNRLSQALLAAQDAIGAAKPTQTECQAALYNLRQAKNSLVMQGVNEDEIKLSNIMIVPSSLILNGTGSTGDLRALVEPWTAGNHEVVWETSNSAVATVANGTVTAVRAGTANITAEAADGSGTKATIRVIVTGKILVEGIIVTPTELNFTEIGATETLDVRVTPDTATNQNVVWTTSDPDVADVTDEGTVTATGNGTATITATAADGSGITAEVAVNVTIVTDPDAVPVEKIIVTPTELNFNAIGQTETLAVEVKPDTATNKNVVWRSSNESVASVTAQGKVTATGNGTATITATAADGSGIKREVPVTVTIGGTNPVLVERIIVTPTELNFTEIGATETLDVRVTPDTATNQNVVWTTDHPEVAEVTEEGTVTARGNGTATITATAADESGKTATVTVNVNIGTVPGAILVEGITVTPSTLNFDRIGATETLSVKVTPETATNQNVVWTTDHPEVAEVTEEGTVTARGNGTATITATAADGSGIKKEVSVNVTIVTDPGAVMVEEITVTPSTLNFDRIGATETLSATVKPDTATNKNVVWTTSDAKVAEVTEEGKVTAIGKGSATITATAADGSGKMAEVTVNVTINDSEVKTFTVTFQANGGSGAPKAVTVENGELVMRPTVVPKRAGYTFKNWFEAKSGGTAYDFSAPVTKDLVLYAQWNPNRYSVSFNSAGGTAVPAQQVYMDQKATKPKDPKKDGYTFGGWFTDSACRTSYNFNSLVKGSVTLYAKWIPSNAGLKNGDIREVGKLQYKVKDAGKKTVVVYKGMNKKEKKLVIPPTVEIDSVIYNVVGIESNAFKGFKKLTSVQIGANVTTIGKSAFASCKKLKTVIVAGKALKTIQKTAFKGTASKMVVKAKKLNKKKKAALLKKLKKAGMSKKAKIR